MTIRNVVRKFVDRVIPPAETAEGSHAETVTTGFPPGHFYSPVVDTADLQARKDVVWRSNPENVGIDFNDEHHRFILEQVFPQFIAGYDYADELEETPGLSQYFTNNSQFGWLDSRVLHVLLRHVRPGRIIEVGGGFSTLLSADVNHRYLNDSAHFACIEPYPREFLRKKIPGLNELVTRRVEDIPLDYFSGLARNDILFIDSSHVSKTGSDVNYLIFEILPRLQPGVLVHIHDIFLPNEYPQHWVLDELRSWNEQYVVRALLMHSNAFRVYFGSSYAFSKHAKLVEAALRLPEGRGWGGGSLWIERV